jgi:ribosomal protein S18 acetylase RimI-like enzyme
MQKQNGNEEAFRALGLRPATSEDEPFLRNLFATTRSDELALLNWDENQKKAFIAMQFNAQSRQYVMSYPHAHNSIILLNDAPIGRLLLDRGEREFTLVDVALLPAHRGAGIGTHLIEDFLLEAAAAGKPVKLNVWHSNPAKKLYQRMGFSAANDDGVYCEMWWNPGLSINEPGRPSE